MAKRSRDDDDDNVSEQQEESSEEEKSKSVSKKKTKVEEKPKSETGSEIKKNGEGDSYIELSSSGKGSRRVTARSFKGVKMIDIREYYNDGGTDKPGKKGISLTPDQWKHLSTNTAIIDKMLDDLSSK